MFLRTVVYIDSKGISIAFFKLVTMWGAIKSDLLSFVTTIQDDTTKTLHRVLGDDEEEVC